MSLSINSSLSSIQSTISLGIDSITNGTQQIDTLQAAKINSALDSFQSVQSESGITQIQTPSVFSDAASFTDPMSFYKQQNSDGPVVQQLKNPAFQAGPNLKLLAEDLRKMNTAFASGDKADIDVLQYNSSMVPPSEIDMQMQRLGDQLKAKRREIENVNTEIKQKMEEINKKQDEIKSSGEWSTGAPVVDDILGELLPNEISPTPSGAYEELAKLQREAVELQVKEQKLMKEMEDLSAQMEKLTQRKMEQEQPAQTDAGSKSELKLMVDPFWANILPKPDQTMLDFQRLIGLQLQTADRLRLQGSMFIKP